MWSYVRLGLEEYLPEVCGLKGLRCYVAPVAAAHSTYALHRMALSADPVSDMDEKKMRLPFVRVHRPWF